MAAALVQQLSRADTIVLGRVTYCAMAGFWMSRSGDLDLPREDLAFADMMNRYNKIVFSKTLTKTSWQKSVIISGDIKNEVEHLKKQAGKNLIVYGSGTLVNSLIQMNLVDEYTLWVHPVILGDGKPLFKRPGKMIAMDLLHTQTFSSGVVKMDFCPASVSIEKQDDIFILS